MKRAFSRGLEKTIEYVMPVVITAVAVAVGLFAVFVVGGAGAGAAEVAYETIKSWAGA